MTSREPGSERAEAAFPGLDVAAVARALGLVFGETDARCEVYCERRIDLEQPPAETPLGLRERREEGLAVRLASGGREWLAARDGLGARELGESLRQVARVWPAAAPAADLEVGASEVAAPFDEIAAFPSRLDAELRRRLAAFPYRITTRWHRRDVQVVGPRVVPPPQRESFFSLDVELPWGRCGAVLPRLDAGAAAGFAERLVARFRAREAKPPATGRVPMVFGPAACAVLLHEAVAHALEADVLAEGGRPSAAIGLDFGSPRLDVLDDPAAAPAGVERTSDDEGMPTLRRWLLRGGRVEQPIADAAAAARWPELAPGSGFRSGRHGRPRPRTHHLELVAGDLSAAELAAAADGGLWVGEIASGALDAASGRFVLEIPAARRLAGGEPGESVGRFRVAGRVAELLRGVRAVGAERLEAGAGWCAKAGERRAVWARVPALAVDGLEVTG